MPDEFPYDVFLSHSAKDKAVARRLAERLRRDGLMVPFNFGFRISDFGFAKPGMSANAFGSDWAQLEAGTFRFRDPLNKERRFLPLRLDDALVPGSSTARRFRLFACAKLLPSVLLLRKLK